MREGLSRNHFLSANASGGEQPHLVALGQCQRSDILLGIRLQRDKPQRIHGWRQTDCQGSGALHFHAEATETHPEYGRRLGKVAQLYSSKACIMVLIGEKHDVGMHSSTRAQNHCM